MMYMAGYRRAVRLVALGGLALTGLAAPAFAEPAVDISKPDADSEVTGERNVDVSVSVRDPKGLKSIDVLLKDPPREKGGKRNLRIRPRVPDRLKQLEGVPEYPLSFQIPVRALKDGKNSILLRVENMLGEVNNVSWSFRYRKPKGTIYLVSIGINKYRQSSIPALKYAESDARAVAKYFREQVGVPKSNIFTFIGQKAKRRPIVRLLADTLKRKAGRNDQIVIFYAGHGVPEFDKFTGAPDQVRKFLLPWDGETDALNASAIPMDAIDAMSQSYVSERVVFLLDTCFSGAAARRNSRTRTLDLAMRGRRSVRLDDGFLNRMAKAKGKVVLTASGINEASQELDSLRHGVFTYYLLEGLKGRADFDANGMVSVPEIHKYLSETVPPRTNQEQQPTYFMNSQVTGEIVLGRSPVAAVKFDARDPWSDAGEFGRLILQASPADAYIYIDGIRRGRGFINTLLREGTRRIRVAKDGYRADTREIEIKRRSLSQLELSLKRGMSRNVIKRSPPPP